jgi:hypothetical protein
MNIREAVAEKIKNSTSAVTDAAVDIMAQKVIQKRVEQVVAAFTELDNLDRELKKCKPDLISYNDDGSVKDTSWSKGAFEARKKLSDRHDKIEKALEAALGDKGDFNSLASLGGKGGDEKKSNDA